MKVRVANIMVTYSEVEVPAYCKGCGRGAGAADMYENRLTQTEVGRSKLKPDPLDNIYGVRDAVALRGITKAVVGDVVTSYSCECGMAVVSGEIVVP